MPQPPRRSRIAPRTGSPAGALLSFPSSPHPINLVALLAGVGAALAGLPPFDVAALLLAPLAVNGTSGSSSLENGTRRSVYDRVRDHPGSTIAEVAESVGVSHSTATYHLETLEDAGLVVSIIDGNKRRFFANAGAYDARERRTLAALENETTHELVAVLARRGPMYRSHLAEELGVAPPTVNWHLDRLEGVDAVAEEPDGRVAVDDSLAEVLDGLLGKLEGADYDADELSDLAGTLSD